VQGQFSRCANLLSMKKLPCLGGIPSSMPLGGRMQSLSLNYALIAFSSLKHPGPKQDLVEIHQVIEEAKKTHWSVSILSL